MKKPGVGCREFIEAAGSSAAALGTTGILAVKADDHQHSDVPIAPAIKFSKLAFITDYSPCHLGMEFDPSHPVRQYIDPYQAVWDVRDRLLAIHLTDTEVTQPILQQVGILGKGWWRYRIPGQGLIDWPRFLTMLLQVGFNGGSSRT